jgi:hypothetical protein
MAKIEYYVLSKDEKIQALTAALADFKNKWEIKDPAFSCVRIIHAIRGMFNHNEYNCCMLNSHSRI